MCRKGTRVNVTEPGVGGGAGIETVQSNLAGDWQVSLVAGGVKCFQKKQKEVQQFRDLASGGRNE